MLSTLKHPLAKAHKGSSLVEYSILAGLVAVASISSIAVYGGHLSDVFSTATEDIAEARDKEPGETAPITPSREPWSFPAAPAGAACKVMTDGNDTVLLTANPEFTCYHLLAGVDSFDGSATSKPLSVYTNPKSEGADDPDGILLGEGDDFLDGKGLSEVQAGGGNDSVRLNLGVTPQDLDFDMGSGDDVLHLTTTGYDDTSPYQRIDVHLQAGKDEAMFACDHPTKPPYNLRTWDDASIKSSCRTEIFFDEAGFDTSLDVTMENLTWASGTHFLAPGKIDARYKLTSGNYIFEFHKDVAGQITIDSIAPQGDEAGLDLKFWKHGGAQKDLTVNVNGRYHQANIILPPELSSAIDLDFEIDVWSNITFYLGERSVIGEFPDVSITGSKLRLDFLPWSGATDDDLRLALLDAGGNVILDYDMAIASASASTLTVVDPEDHAIAKIRLTRQGQEKIIPINGDETTLQVHTIGIRHE